eukprot:9502690-Pyramimonas_sp.AAC.1
MDKEDTPVYLPDPWKPWPTFVDAVEANQRDQHNPLRRIRRLPPDCPQHRSTPRDWTGLAAANQ